MLVNDIFFSTNLGIWALDYEFIRNISTKDRFKNSRKEVQKKVHAIGNFKM